MSLDGTGAIADFDSASGLLRALAAFLHGQDFPALGLPRFYAPPAKAATRLPAGLRRQLYAFGGWLEAQPARRVAALEADSVARWVTGLYPDRTYPAIAVGAANGALLHLFAAMGIPWLPQTWLLPLRGANVPVDDGRRALEAARPAVEGLLKANPGLAAHHMHDPVQDRLMLRHMSYLRLKRLRLGRAYEAFIRRSLAPGGTIYVIDCQQSWPVTRLGERHVFQFGAVGGYGPEAFHGDRSAYQAFVRQQRGDPARISVPEPTEDAPEAEWGFDQVLAEDIERLAEERGYEVRDITFATPEAASAPIADLHRLWYREIGRPANRLLGENFILVEPMQALRQALIPFWMVFNKQASAEALAAYAGSRGPFHTILAMLFAHGVEGGAMPSLDDWQGIVGQATGRGRILGVDAGAWPVDLGVFARYHEDLAAEPGERLPVPTPIAAERAEAFLQAVGTSTFRLH